MTRRRSCDGRHQTVGLNRFQNALLRPHPHQQGPRVSLRLRMSFENASVTKGLMMGSALSSICVGMFDVKHYFHLQLVPHISRHHQFWRLVTHNLAFVNSSDLFLALLVFYNVGIHVERQFGSVKYASYAVVTLIMGTLLEFIALLLFHRVGLQQIAMGPSLLTFSLLYQYSRIVPAVYTYKIFGVSLSSKSLNYFLGLQLAISRLPASAAVALIGILTGQIYRSDLAGLKSYRLSPRIVRFAQTFLLPLVGSLRPPRRSNRALPDDGSTSSSRPTVAPASRENDEVITTARRTPRSARFRQEPDTPNPGSVGAGPGSTASSGGGAPNTSVMREWVNELTGRAERANAGVRVPSEDEIAQAVGIFPDLDREVIIAALQRR
ncbi:hypothetical protein DFP72DRAFT_877603 [Ephemerocybe angulata]|uniref:Derlin n=1 Tax=Ephemerocybe angulata TaxID=980116 RepID=A0A8H6IAJ2_9AGAR|nr:hypothetical protein DFP72DRAFT_877603 [Tulosesus angulatus]